MSEEELEEVVLLIMFQTSLHRAQIKEMIWFIIHSIITNILIFSHYSYNNNNNSSYNCVTYKKCVWLHFLHTWLKRALQVLLNAATNY